MTGRFPRFMIAAPASGQGKTTVTCALLTALKRRGLDAASFKCGPDFIDPMFHREVIGAKSANLDLFFTDPETVRGLFARRAENCDVSLVEGVMGYYDGLSMTDSAAGSWDLARTLGLPTVLVVNARGSAASAAAVVHGFATFRPDAGIRGVILNHSTRAQFEALAPYIERETGVRALGFLPADPAFAIGSRHLGLVTAGEITELRRKLELLADAAEQCIDIDALLALAKEAPTLAYDSIEVLPETRAKPVVAVARDRAFCFYYEENLELLRELGAEITEFSPLADPELPRCDALYLGGGYPELYLPQLAANRAMRRSVAAAVGQGLPTLAECGGFMYLQRSITGTDGKTEPMCGVCAADCRMTARLGRFGYITLTAAHDTLLLQKGERIAAHEFHYSDSDDNGDACLAEKPRGGRCWDCVQAGATLFAGYPHLYFRSDPQAARRFVRAAADYKRSKETR